MYWLLHTPELNIRGIQIRPCIQYRPFLDHTPVVLIHTYHTHIYEVRCHSTLRCKIEIEYVYEACNYYTTITITRTIRSDEHLQRMTVIHILALAQLAEVGIERHKRVRRSEIE